MATDQSSGKNDIEEEEEEDPVDRLLSKSGCAKYHYAVQDCMVEHKDWRKCQKEVTAFRECISQQQNQKKT
ncbi:cytochrome c oxidase assembly factor 4 homolog, mitochondrial-like [Ptychodera flava]|uniref:cytochrome c oxidase assembly factor 4 homolog, mitochondrial-like n=1 Tax=Ptychodera flava TaxID=63121 RepID=UPI00396A3BCA